MKARIAAQIHTSEAWTLKSENTGQEYRISVSLPASYDHTPQKTFPTVYVVDSNVFYEMVTGADPLDKTLLGDSSGGHFGLYALLTEPGSFQRYVVGSSSLGYGEKALFKLESAYAEAHQELPARLFLGIGDQDELAPFSAYEVESSGRDARSL